ncbi:uncharacterized protein Pyn_18265 [Prunus yedoensis var. nudiflora]|uniref:Uncharacterized protein n=1 Tax=Prunus yedoensis var. nudiflora TaxID=2094558 RepID=A0A314YQI4_PRUYE|nr:uncharacterized protein Pyn_18265 [Prunus yedoensis var. nudiflora]
MHERKAREDRTLGYQSCVFSILHFLQCHSLGPAGPRNSRSSARLPPEASIQEGFATNPISSGTESRAGRVEPEVPESAPAESTPGTSGKSHSMFAVMKKITKFFKL